MKTLGSIPKRAELLGFSTQKRPNEKERQAKIVDLVNGGVGHVDEVNERVNS